MLLISGDGDKLFFTTGEDTWIPFSESVEIGLVLGEVPGEGVLVPVLAGEVALSRSGEGAVCLNSGETLFSLSSGDGTNEITGEGGVYRGAGVETVLPGSAVKLVSWFSGVDVVYLPVLSGSEINSRVWRESSISGVEPLLKRSGRETLPLSSGKGDDA